MCTLRPPVPSGPGRTLLGLAFLAAALVSFAPPAGAQTDFAAGLSGPIGFTQLTDGTVLVAEFDAGRVSAYPPGGGARTDFATELGSPYGLTQLADGRVLVAENSLGRVSAFPAGGGNANRTDFATGLSSPSDVTQLADGRVLVSERGNRVSAFPAGGGDANRTDFATTVRDPLRVTQLADGRVLVSEFRGARVSAFPAEGGDANRTDFATGLRGPVGVVQLANGRVLVAELRGGVLSFPATGGDAGTDATVFDDTVGNPYGVTQLADSRVLIAAYSTGRVVAYGSAVLPPVACSSAAPLSFDADGSGGAVTADDFSPTGGGLLGEFVGVRHEGSEVGVDLTACSFVSFDPFGEASVRFTAPTTATVGAGAVYTLATTGGDQTFGEPDVLTDAPGGFALVTGMVAPGELLTPALVERVVAAVVYDRDGTVVGSVRGGLPPADAEIARAEFAQALVRAFGGATSAEDGGDVDLAVTAWPNPSAGAATVSFGLAASGAARVSVYDALGREVAVVADRAFGTGRHTVRLAVALPAGLYVVRVSTPAGVETAQLTVVR